MKRGSKVFLPLIVIVVLLGVGSGYVLAQKMPGQKEATLTPKTATTTQTTTADTKVVAGKTYGSTDTKTFKDDTEGVLLLGGVNGEGSHHIVREGGESQTVYLTSSIVDLSQFENHKVKVLGETFKAQRAGWLMDVGQVQVIELNATLPDWLQKQQEKASGGND